MATISMKTLSSELKLRIVEFIIRPSDLKQLALVCRALRPLATAALYCRVQVDFKDLRASDFHPFDRRGHSGHQYVRELHFVDSVIAHDSDRCVAARLLLMRIPSNALRAVSFPLRMNVDKTLLELLSLEQRRLTTVMIGPMGLARLHAGRAFSGHLKLWIYAITNLTIPNVSSERSHSEDVNALGRLLAEGNTLTCLELSDPHTGNVQSLQGPRPARALADLLCCYVESNDKIAQFRLSSLTLRNLSIGSATARLLKAIDFSQLMVLTLSHTSRYEGVLQGLAELWSHGRGKSKALTINTLGRLDFAVLSALLDACRKLEKLEIHVMGRANSMPAIASLEQHAPTLRIFGYSVQQEDFVNDTIITHRCPDLLFERVICKAMNLEELAIHLGDVNLPYTVKHSGPLDTFSHRLHSLVVSCPRLRALRLLVWPCFRADIVDDLNDPDENGDFNTASIALLRYRVRDNTAIFCDRMLRAFAESRQRLGLRALLVLAIASSDGECIVRAGEDSIVICSYPVMDPMICISRNSIDSGGRHTVSAHFVRKEDVSYDDREYDILDW